MAGFEHLKHYYRTLEHRSPAGGTIQSFMPDFIHDECQISKANLQPSIKMKLTTTFFGTNTEYGHTCIHVYHRSPLGEKVTKFKCF